MTVLVIAEHFNQQIKPATLATITAGLALADSITLFIAGHQCESLVDQARYIQGVAKVLVVDSPALEKPLAEVFTPLIIQQIELGYRTVLAPATTFGKNIMPRVAGKLGIGMQSDIIKIIAPNKYQRPIYAGNAIIEVESLDDTQLLTVRPTAFSGSQPAGKPNDLLEVIESSMNINNALSEFIKLESQSTDMPELASAELVISGGRGVQDEAGFQRLTTIAKRMGAAIGASRAAVDAGFAPNDYQVGQTGQVVAPKVYIAVGISGAIQHLAGMKESSIIVAINKDPDAPIFNIADYGLVADIKEVFSRWEAKLTEMGL